jgi:hypothetical protein
MRMRASVTTAIDESGISTAASHGCM